MSSLIMAPRDVPYTTYLACNSFFYLLQQKTLGDETFIQLISVSNQISESLAQKKIWAFILSQTQNSECCVTHSPELLYGQITGTNYLMLMNYF